MTPLTQHAPEDPAALALVCLSVLGHERGQVEFRLLPGKGSSARFQREFVSPKRRPTALADLLAANAAAPSALTFGVNPRIGPGGRDSDVREVVACALDLDGSRSKTLAEQRQLAARFAELVCSCLIVESGTAGHLHVYWRFEPPCEPERARALVKRLRSWLDTDPSEPPSKMMRLPGSANWKSGSPIQLRPTFIEHHSCTPEEFEAALDQLEVPQVETKRRRRSSTSGSRRSRRPAARAPVPDLAEARRDQIWSVLPSWAHNLILDGHEPNTRYPSASEAVAAVSRVLVDAACTDEEIRWFFAATPEGIGQRYYERGDDYLDRAIEFARFTAEPESWVLVCKVLDLDSSRVMLVLRVEHGAHEGEVFEHGVQVGASVWPAVFRSAGLTPPFENHAAHALSLEGRWARVRLGTWGWAKNLEVKRWLPWAEPSLSDDDQPPSEGDTR